MRTFAKRVVTIMLVAAVTFVFMSFGGTMIGHAALGVQINTMTFPDKHFREFVSSRIDNGDGILSAEEVENVTEIAINSSEISSLIGIEHFNNLKSLNCDHNLLTKIDVSKNTKLETLSCEGNQLEKLDITNNTGLINLLCGGNKLKELNVKKNTALEYLGCDNNQLKELNVLNNTKLVDLFCYGNQLTKLDLSRNTKLKMLECQESQLTSLDLTNNTSLEWLYCFNNKLTSLEISKNTALETLHCSNNQLTSLDTSKNTVLKDLECSDNQLTSLDVSKNIALIRLNCEDNQLKKLNVMKNTALRSLYCCGNQLLALHCKDVCFVDEDCNQERTIKTNSSTIDLKDYDSSIDPDRIKYVYGAEIDGTVLKNLTKQIQYTYDDFLNVTLNIEVEKGSANQPSSNKKTPAKKTQPVKKISAGTVKVLSTSSKTAAFMKAKNKRSITVPATVKIGGKTYKVTRINANAFKGSKIRTVTIGKNVKVIKKNAFKGSRATKLILKTKLLKKAKIKGCLKNSKVKYIQLKLGSKRLNKKYLKSYKKIFMKGNAGKKVTVK